MQAKWEEFLSDVYLGNIAPSQKEEMKHLFYSGAAAMLMLGWELGSDEYTEAQGNAIMLGIKEEINDFIDSDELEVVKDH